MTTGNRCDDAGSPRSHLLASLPARWDSLTTADFRTLMSTGRGTPGTGGGDTVVAVLPLAATEQHGAHLPVAVDAVINRAILGRAVAKLPAGTPVLTLPEQAIGFSPEHIRFPGTLTISANAAITVWTDIIESVVRAGVRRLLIFNSHGGQPQIAQLLIRDARVRLGMIAATVSWPDFGLPPDLTEDNTISQKEIRHGLHAGQIETSMMLAIDPASVRRQALGAAEAGFASRAEAMADRYVWLQPEGAVRIGWRAEDLDPSGVTGNAAAATAEIGEALLEHASDALSRLLQELTDPALTEEWALSGDQTLID